MVEVISKHYLEKGGRGSVGMTDSRDSLSADDRPRTADSDVSEPSTLERPHRSRHNKYETKSLDRPRRSQKEKNDILNSQVGSKVMEPENPPYYDTQSLDRRLKSKDNDTLLGADGGFINMNGKKGQPGSLGRHRSKRGTCLTFCMMMLNRS